MTVSTNPREYSVVVVVRVSLYLRIFFPPSAVFNAEVTTMSQRNTTIALTDEEKQRLDAAREAIFGTDEVPYGEVVKKLTERFR